MTEIHESAAETVRDPYVITRKLYKWEAMFETLCTQLATGGFLAKVSITLGVRDSITALIGTLASLACVLSLVSGYLQQHTPIKRWLLPMAEIARPCMIVMYLLPFFRIKNGIDIILLVLVFVAQAAAAMVTPAKQNMFMATVSTEQRTSYLAVVNMVSRLFAIPLLLFGGTFLDYMEEGGRLKEAFLIIAVAIFAFGICHMLTLIFSKEPPMRQQVHKNVFNGLGSLFHNKKFRFFMITSLVNSIAQGVLAPYLVTYVQKDFGFSMFTYNMFNAIQMLLCLLGFLLVTKLGKRVKATTLRTVFFVAYICYDFLWLMMSKETAFAWHFPVEIACAVLNVASISSTVCLFWIVEEKDRVSAIAFSGALMGVCTFVTNLAITPLFDLMQDRGVSLFGAPAYPQQILGIFSVGLRMLALCLWLFEKKNYKEM